MLRLFDALAVHSSVSSVLVAVLLLVIDVAVLVRMWMRLVRMRRMMPVLLRLEIRCLVRM